MDAASPFEALAGAETRALASGEVAAGLLDAVGRGDLLFLARDGTRAAEIHAAIAAGAPQALVLLCPGSDALPGDAAPPSPANVGLRASALRKRRAELEGGDRRRIVLVSTGEAAARLYPAPERFTAAPPLVRVGEKVDLAAFAGELEAIGYVPDDRVDEPGEIALRGQVIDIFPADAGCPYRIEAVDERIAAIRAYDPVTQLSTGECESLELGRVSEPELGSGVTLLDHLPGAVVAIDAGAEERRKRFLKLAADTARKRPARALRDICLDEAWQDAIAGRARIDPGHGIGEPPPRFAEGRVPMRGFVKTARQALAEGSRLVLVGTSRDLRFLRPRVARALGVEPVPVASWAEAKAAEPGSVPMLPMPVRRGFRLGDLVAIAAGDLLGSRAQRDEEDAATSGADLFALGEIRLGDVVVHEDHGVAIITGLEPLPGDDDLGEAIVLRFAADARRLVPVAEADRIWRYGADEEAVTLDRLDGSSWQKRRGDIDAAMAEAARGLIDLAAKRLELQAPVLVPDSAAYERFVAEFPYTETPDQARAIDAVRIDLASGKPMDRLVVGDVGYGKTEVALRAAAMAALAGKQVALAAPTTVLVRQHLETFRQRFEGTGLIVAGLSRLSSAAEKKAARAGLADGSIAIVIGTGAVAGKDLTYKNLALVIIDEEQRFGAADKAKLRALCGDPGEAGHVLTLSATPIPRTLQNALVGLQQLSTISTPPARRQPIRTTIARFDAPTIRTFLLRERSRGGQSFVVVPRIEDMAPMAQRLTEAAPELELLQAHGKMPAAEIDESMVRFAGGDGDVLLATNIIEAGLDVPRANTMLVWRADRFGLSQLHQLRGRVGRGGRRGQVLLVTDGEARIAPRTLARLNTLQAFDRLGAGFAISARDLDMRGAGDLLGETQAGHVKLIGVDLYQHMLEASLRVARGELADHWLPTLNLGVGGRLPETWIPEPDLRTTLYSRLARIVGLGELDAFEAEAADRFGELPDEAQRLLAVARVRILARSLGIERIDAGPAAIALTPRSGSLIDAKAAGLEAKNGRLLLTGSFADAAERLERVEVLLQELG
jgi:transcription-repair coupling factor (superfamily II helicase)